MDQSEVTIATSRSLVSAKRVLHKFTDMDGLPHLLLYLSAVTIMGISVARQGTTAEFFVANCCAFPVRSKVPVFSTSRSQCQFCWCSKAGFAENSGLSVPNLTVRAALIMVTLVIAHFHRSVIGFSSHEHPKPPFWARCLYGSSSS